MVCKALLGRLPPEMEQRLIGLFSPKQAETLLKMPPPAPLGKEALQWDLLSHLHYSWLAPYLRTLAPGDIRLFFAALSSTQAKGLEKALGLPNDLPKLTKVARRSIRALLLQQVIHEEERVPLPFLPESPLNQLLTLTPSTLKKLIHYLGLHDLSFEMRQIIATKTLKQIFATLPEKQGEYLKTLLLHREPLIYERLFLEKWDGSKAQLQGLIEERGLHRLAHALYFCHPDLSWYFTHRIDMHLATKLLKYDDRPTHSRAQEILFNQIQKNLERLQTKGSS